MEYKNRILLVSASPKQLNSNEYLIHYVFDALVHIAGAKNVVFSDYESMNELALLFRPHIVIIFGSILPDVCDYSPIRKVCDQILSKLVFWLHDDPYEFDAHEKITNLADYIFTNDKFSSFFYNREKVFHLPLGACEKAHYKPIKDSPEIDVFFCGTAYPKRIHWIKDLSFILKKYKTQILGDQWKISEPFCINEKLTNSQLVSFYNNSLVTINIGRDLNLANNKYLIDPSTPGPRTFEAAMAGTTQLFFVESLEVLEYFENEKEILLFNTINDFRLLIEKIIDNRALAKSIAKQSQLRAQKEHTYKNRVKYLLKMINS